MRSAFFWDSAQPRTVVSASLLKIGHISCPETSVRHYHSTLGKIAKQRGPQLLILITLEMGSYET